MARPSPDPLFVLRGSLDAVNTVQFYSPTTTDKDFLISGCSSGEVRVWSLSSRRSEVTLNGHEGRGILKVHSLSDDSIVSHGRDHHINVWNIADGRKDITARLEAPSMTFCKCDIIPKDDKNHFVAISGLERSEVRVHHLESQAVVHRLIPPEGYAKLGMPMSVHFIDPKQLLVGYEDGSVLQWNLETNQIMAEKKLHGEPVMCLDYLSDISKGMSGSADDKLVSFTLNTPGDMQVTREVQLTNPGLSAVRIRCDGQIVATGGWDARIRLFGAKKLKRLAIMTYHTASVNCLDFSSQSLLLAAGSKDKHISIWSVYDTVIDDLVANHASCKSFLPC